MTISLVAVITARLRTETPGSNNVPIKTQNALKLKGTQEVMGPSLPHPNTFPPFHNGGNGGPQRRLVINLISSG